MTNLSNIQAIYDTRLAYQVKTDVVREDTLRGLIQNLRKVVRTIQLSDSRLNYLRPIRRYAYLLPTSLLRLNAEEIFPFEGISDLRKIHAPLGAAYPSLKETLEKVLSDLEMLKLDNRTPLLDRVIEQAKRDVEGSAGVLVRERGLLEATQAEVEARMSGWVRYLMPKELSGLECFDTLFVPGPSCFYPEYLFRSPRAAEIHIVRYSWSIDREPPASSFVKAYRAISTVIRVDDAPTSTDSEDTLSSEDFDELRPRVDVEGIAGRYRHGNPSAEDLVVAHLILLEGEKGVFLKEDAFTVDLSAPAKQRVEKVSLVSLVEGDCIALRTARGGDYVAEVADRLLGNKAKVLRSKQQQWKTLLHKQVQEKTLLVISRYLTDLGARVADPMNVRNWMSGHNLGPGSPQDFAVVLHLLGLEASISEYQTALEELRAAHRRAGREIRHKLIQQIEQSDLSPLERDGYQKITLPDEDGGSISIYRVTERPEQAVEVPYRQLTHVFKL